MKRVYFIIFLSLLFCNSFAQTPYAFQTYSGTASSVSPKAGNFLIDTTSGLYLFGDLFSTKWDTIVMGVIPSSGVTKVGTLDSVFSSKGDTVIGTAIYGQSASSTKIGFVNISAQSFTGLKTFSSGITSGSTITGNGAIQILGGSSTSSYIERNVNDANSVFILFNGNSSSTGHFIDMKNSSGTILWHVNNNGSGSQSGADTILGTSNFFTLASSNLGDSLLGKNSFGQTVSIPANRFVTVSITDTTITSSVTAKPYYRYYVNSSSLVTITLPSTLTIFNPIQVIGVGTGGWKIAQNAGQTMHSGTSANTTTGTSGYIQSQTQYSCISLRAISTTDMVIDNSQGSPLFN